MSKTYGTLVYKPKTNAWVIDAQPHVHMRAKRIFGKISKQQAGNLSLSHSIDTCRDLEWFLDRYPLTLTPDDRDRLVASARRTARPSSGSRT